MAEFIDTDVSNYYGSVDFVKRDGKYYLELGDYSGTCKKEISREFFLAACKEFDQHLDGEA
jgi:hypothetical protein